MAKRKKDGVRAEYTAEQILQMVRTQGASTPFQAWVSQMQKHYDLFSLEPYVPDKKGHQAYTSPRPRNDFLKVFHGVNKATLTWKVALPEDASEGDRKAASKIEDLLAGIIGQADQELRDNGESSLREGLGAFAGLRGAGGLVCRIYPDESKDTQIDIRPLDPLHMRFQRGVKGLVWASYEYKVSAAEARERWGVELAGEEQPGVEVNATVVDFYDRRINAVVLATGSKAEGEAATSQFIKVPTAHGLDHVPMFIGFSSGLPTFFDEDFQPDFTQKAASVYAASAETYPAWNKQVSTMMDVAELQVGTALAYFGPAGSLEGKIKESPWLPRTILELPMESRLQEIFPPKLSEASGAVIGALNKDIQESTMAYPVAYGQDPQGHSGVALQVMTDNMKSIYGPFTRLLEDAFRWLCREILVQFKAKGQKITLRGFSSDGKFFEMEADPADVNDEAFLKVTCVPQLPRDEAGMLQMGKLASEPGRDGEPLVSRYTARDKYLMLQNPDAEATRIEDERVERLINMSPVLQIKLVANKLIERSKSEKNPGLAQLAMELLASIPAPGGQQRVPMPQTAPGPRVGAPEGVPPGPPPPEVVAEAQLMAQAAQAEGQPIPPEVAMVLQMAAAQGGPVPP